MIIYIYINNVRVSIMEALEFFWSRARAKQAFSLEETRRIFDAALIDHSEPHLKILQQFGLDVLTVYEPRS